MRPELVKMFIREFNTELARATAAANMDTSRRLHELDKVNRGIREIIEAVKSGFRSSAMAAELTALEARKQEIEAVVTQSSAPKPRVHPNVANLYRDKVADLHNALDRAETRGDAAGILRGLIAEVRLVPEDGQLQIEQRGDLAAILSFAQKEKPGARDAGLKIKLVAEEGLEPPTNGL